jgi:hypothetical protein
MGLQHNLKNTKKFKNLNRISISNVYTWYIPVSVSVCQRPRLFLTRTLLSDVCTDITDLRFHSTWSGPGKGCHRAPVLACGQGLGPTTVGGRGPTALCQRRPGALPAAALAARGTNPPRARDAPCPAGSDGPDQTGPE